MKVLAVFVLFFVVQAFGALSICDKYTGSNSTNFELVNAVVIGTFTKAVAGDSTIRQYFNGTLPPKIDFITDLEKQEALALSLTNFFGAALGCTDGSIGNYTGGSMTAVHEAIPITYAAYYTFNKDVLSVLDDAGVSEADLATVSGVLRSLKTAICNQDDCQTICNRYSDILGISNADLLAAVVGQTFALAVANNSPIKKYFDGTVPAGSINYLTNAEAAEALGLSLATFFGDALGCSDGTLPPYAGNPNMTAVHAGIPITYEAYRTFNLALLSVLEANGVAEADLNAINGVLKSLKPAICNQADCNTICNRYSDALDLSNYQLMETVVVNTFTLITNNTSPIKSFFNGTTPAGSTNYLTNTVARENLVESLVEFFGQEGILGCSDGTVDEYTGNANMTAVHAAMPIGQTEFDSFNNALLQVVTQAGLTTADVTAINTVLQSTKSAICNQCPEGPTATETTADESSAASLVALLAAPLAVILTYF